MIKYYKTNPREKGVVAIDAPQKDCWIHLEAPTIDELNLVISITGMPENFIKSALDEEEVAHLDEEGDSRMIVLDIPKMDNDGDSEKILTLPLAMIQNDEYIVSVCTASTTIVDDFTGGKIKNIDTAQRSKLIYQIMYNNTLRFLYYLRRIDKSSSIIEKSLAKTMQNREIFQLLDLQKSLVFFSASLTANYALVNRIANNVAKVTEEERAILDDVIIENKQAMEMCSIYREIIKSTMDAFASVVNNNQNIVMKILTIITIILAVPTMIAGFWGMNTAVPFEGRLWGFWAAIAISLFISIGLFIFMIKKKLFK